MGINNAGIPAASAVHFAIPSQMYRIWADIFMGNKSPIDHPSRMHIRPTFGVYRHPRALRPGITVFFVRDNSPLKGKVQEGDALLSVGINMPDGTKKNLRIDAYGEVVKEDNFILPNSEQPIQLGELFQRLPFSTRYDMIFERQCVGSCALRGGQLLANPAPKTYTVSGVQPARLDQDVGCSKIMVSPFHEIDHSLLFGCCFCEMNAGHIAHPSGVFGVQYMNMTPQEKAADHVVVTHVFAGSLLSQTRAARVGQRLVAVNGQPVRTLADFRAVVRQGMQQGAQLQFRSGELLTMAPSEWISIERALAANGGYRPDPKVFAGNATPSLPVMVRPPGTEVLMPGVQLQYLLQKMASSGRFRSAAPGHFVDVQSGASMTVRDHGNGMYRVTVSGSPPRR